MNASLTPPADLRPAQLGVVLLGRVILGHIGATFVDLAQRGFLRIDEIPGDDGTEWLLTDLRGGPAPDRAGLLRFESALLDGVFAGQSTARLGEIGHNLIPALNRVRRLLYRDAVRQGWLRRWRHHGRTARGEQLVKQIQSFRRELRALAASGDAEAMARLAPYAIVFGLGVPQVAGLPAEDKGTAQRRESEVQWSCSDRFVTQWLAICAAFPRSGRYARGGGDFVKQWSAPHEHGHGHGGHSGHGHGPAHGGYGGGHGGLGHGGGHGGGGFGAGGHGGH